MSEVRTADWFCSKHVHTMLIRKRCSAGVGVHEQAPGFCSECHVEKFVRVHRELLNTPLRWERDARA